jgi:hypothetical protein
VNTNLFTTRTHIHLIVCEHSLRRQIRGSISACRYGIFSGFLHAPRHFVLRRGEVQTEVGEGWRGGGREEISKREKGREWRFRGRKKMLLWIKDIAVVAVVIIKVNIRMKYELMK